MRRAMGSLVLVAAVLIATPTVANAQTEVDTLTLVATPNPVPLGGTITLTATLTRTVDGVPISASGLAISFMEEARPGCGCGVSLGSDVTGANGVATITVPAASPPLITPAVGMHTFVAEQPGLPSDPTGRATTTVVCPAGETPDPSGNACLAAYPLAVVGPGPAPDAAAPQLALASTGHARLPLGALGVALAAVLAQGSLWVLAVRRRRSA